MTLNPEFANNSIILTLVVGVHWFLIRRIRWQANQNGFCTICGRQGYVTQLGLPRPHETGLLQKWKFH